MTPIFVCVLCPTDQSAFYTEHQQVFEEHQVAVHLGLYDLRPCVKCGELTTGHFNGYCGTCFMAKWGGD